MVVERLYPLRYCVYEQDISGTYSPDIPEPLNADRVIKGGTGYAIQTIDGKETFDKSKDIDLPKEIERMSRTILFTRSLILR
jgi:hypothetical protein